MDEDRTPVPWEPLPTYPQRKALDMKARVDRGESLLHIGRVYGVTQKRVVQILQKLDEGGYA